MKKVILLSSIICLLCMGISFAQETQPSDLQVKFDMAFGTKYVWRGFNVYGSTAAYHPSLDLFSKSTGIGFSVEGHKAVSDYEATERWDFSLYYQGKAFAGEQYELMYRLGYVYYTYPELNSHKRTSIDIQEIHSVLSFPKIFGIDGLVPSYVLVKLMPVNSGSAVGSNSPSGGTASGFAHIFMLDYAMPYVCPISGVDRKLNWHSELVFNDGVAPDGGNEVVKYGQLRGQADHDWSNAVFGASTTYDINSNLSFTPGVFYQLSFDDSVNSEDQLWAKISMTLQF